MSENKNIELNDEQMAQASGGKGLLINHQFNIGDRVTWSWDNGTNTGWSYGTIKAWESEGFSCRILVDQGCPDGGKIITKHLRNLHPLDM